MMGKIKRVFRYTDYLLLILAVGVIWYFKLPHGYNLIFLLLALISKIVIDQKKSKVEKLINTAQNLKRLSDSFSRFVYNNWVNSIPSILDALLANDVFTNGYGKGIKGWKLYFKEKTKNLYHEYSEFTTDLERYIENPKGKIGLSGIIMRFGVCLAPSTTISSFPPQHPSKIRLKPKNYYIMRAIPYLKEDGQRRDYQTTQT
ncbi:MAG TPA: hypothetical protein C5S37_13220 [Methanophagales archaeon]|nr:hypothetical protein [Methanophagales archaeon]